MAAKRHERTFARRAALQVLYSSEITDQAPAQIAEGGLCLTESGGLSPYAEALVRGVGEHCDVLDRHLAQTSENWTLSRMPIVDRTILRLATYEMMFVDDVPTSVAINEAVELAKDFGGEDESPRFVNGVLGRIAKRLGEAEAAAGAQDEAAPADGAPVEAGQAEAEVLVEDAEFAAALAESRALAGQVEAVKVEGDAQEAPRGV